MAVLGALLVGVGLPLANPLFPASEVSSCTIGKKLIRERRVIVPKQVSDCGRFVSRQRVACSSDPGTEVPLIAGVTYDLVVRGPRLGRLTSPTIASATVSEVQTYPRTAAGADLENSWSGAAHTLMEEFSVEALRAFDYEQPPYDAECEVGRSVMTTKGIQFVDAERAAELLAPPPGTAPRAPLLPCRGFPCTDPFDDLPPQAP